MCGRSQCGTPAVFVNLPEQGSGLERFCSELFSKAEIRDHFQCPCEHQLLLILVQFVHRESPLLMCGK